MRRTALPLALLGTLVLAPSTLAQTGGAAAGDPTLAPDQAGGAGNGGGARYGDEELRAEVRRETARRRAPLLIGFSVSPARMFAYGSSARVRFRLRGPRPVRVRLLFAPAGGGRPVASLPLGAREPGRLHTVSLRDGVPEGRWAVRLSGRDERGRRLRRTAKASSAEALSFFAHRFPLAGTGWDLGGEGARFGADRDDHIHQGQDITAPEGTPVVAPRGGVVQHVAFQAEGAGYYVILDGEGEERDYAFMHLREGSVAVSEGQRVRTGQPLGQVGSTGASSGPHLHFEIWEGGDWWNGGHAVDPLPYLQRWASWS